MFIAIAVLSILCVTSHMLQNATDNDPSQMSNSSSCQTVSVGECVKFTLFAGTSVVFNIQKSIILTGSLGVSPGTSVLGNYELLTGNLYSNSTYAIKCIADFETAYSAPPNCTCTSMNFMQNSPMSSILLRPGFYCHSNDDFIFSSGVVIFDGGNTTSGQWIFQLSSTLTFSNSTSFELINGASANNIFWRVGSDVAIGKSSKFEGNILAKKSINFGDGVIFVGRALAQETISFEGISSLAMPLPVSSMEPSSAPSFLLTYPPTRAPSSASTFALLSPTPNPTTMSLVLIEVSQYFQGVDIAVAESKSFEEALQSSVSQTINLPLSNVMISSVDNFATVRDGVSLGNYTAVKVIYTVAVQNGNMSAIIHLLKNPNYTDLLSDLLELSGYTSASGSDVLLRDLSPTSSPTRRHYRPIDFDQVRIIIGITLGLFGFCFLIVYYIYATDILKWNQEAESPRGSVYYSDEVLSNYEINKMMEEK